MNKAYRRGEGATEEAAMMKTIRATAIGTKLNTDGRKWYEVSVCETFKRTFRVLAEDEQGATDCMLSAMADGNADVTKGESECEITGVDRVDEGEYVNTSESEGFFFEHDTDNGAADGEGKAKCPVCGEVLEINFYPRAYANADHDGYEAKCPLCGLVNKELEQTDEDAVDSLYDMVEGK